MAYLRGVPPPPAAPPAAVVPAATPAPTPIPQATLPSGVRIVVERAGTGEGLAKRERATFRFTMQTPDGRVLDTGEIEFAPGTGESFPGLEDGVLGMTTGEKRRITLPPTAVALGRAPQGIPPDTPLEFHIERLEGS